MKKIKIKKKVKIKLIFLTFSLLTISAFVFNTRQRPLAVESNKPEVKPQLPEINNSQETKEDIDGGQGDSKPTQTPPNNPSNSEIKPKDTHASKLLADKDYPQLKYYALKTANDTYYSGSWYHSKIQTNRAWDISTGSESTVVAVIDTGYALSHQDLINSWQTNAGEIGMTSLGGICWTGTPADKKTNDCDDDANGYKDDWRGWDFAYSDNSPQTGEVDPNGDGTQHGTMVSGIIAAGTDNSIGVAGIDWKAKIMPLQVLGDDGSGYTYDIAAAIEYAVDNGAHIINMSLGGIGFDQALLNAINYANSNNVLVIAASGNCGNKSTDECAGLSAPGRMTYPALYDNVLSVGSTTSTDLRSSFSSYGPELDIVAPGSAVGPLASWSSLYTTNGYVSSANGTSFAAPIVAGVASVLRSQLTSPSPSQLTNLLLNSTDRIGDLTSTVRTNQYGYGLVNAHKATLLTKASVNLPGNVSTASLTSRMQPQGGLTRSTSGNVASDEWLLVTCRTEVTDICSATVTNGGSKIDLTPLVNEKGASTYNMFVRGSSLNSGTSTISVHNRSFGYKVLDVVR